MKFHDIPADIIIIRVKSTGNAELNLQEQTVFSVESSLSRLDEFDVRLNGVMVSVKPVAVVDIRRLNTELASGRSYLAQFANPAADGSTELHIAFFTGDCKEFGDIEIAVDEYVEKGMERIGYKKKGADIYKELDSLCCFHQGDNVFFFVTVGAAIDDALIIDKDPLSSQSDGATQDLETLDDEICEQEIEHSVVEGSVVTEPERCNSFCIMGNGIRFVVTETQVAFNKSIFVANRLTKHKHVADRAIRLAKGRLRFLDWTAAGGIQTLAKAQMAALTQDNGSYLKKWDEFGAHEGKILLDKARAVGVIQFDGLESKRDGSTNVHVNDLSETASNALTEGTVQAVELVIGELPEYLQNEALTFEDFAKNIEKAADNAGRKRQEGKANSYDVIRFDRDTKILKLKTESMPATNGFLILSLSGDTAQVKRREAARKAILEGRSANPQLGLLVEEKGVPAPIRQTQKMQALTAFVRHKVFKSPPTLMQEKAIEVALNTPDIALIQGPPGTGKTTVIAAILERLNEMADKRGATIKGQVLLTGYQHDAVENMIDRLKPNGLPVPKFGKRSGSEIDDYDTFERGTENWCLDVAKKLRDRNPQIAEIEQEKEIKSLYLQYIEAPTQALALNLVDKISALGVSVLNEDGARSSALLAKKLQEKEKFNADPRKHLLATVRCLRTRLESFADDGAERAADALDDLKDLLDDDDKKLLNQVSLWRIEDGEPRFLNELAGLKKKLLEKFTKPPMFRVEKQNIEVISLAEFAIRCIQNSGYSQKDKKSAALAEFLAELETNIDGMKNALSEYSFAFAATCQQSVNKRMQVQKGITDSDEKIMEYEYVIVDEAARVSPRDLMVAMAQGKRIILVGDHRQLPHIIDEEVARQMALGETSDSESDWLKKSLFEYLFSARLKALEEIDGVPRRVTLDKQYRMHPVLGDFVSRNFYERFDPTERFGSGRPASDFTYRLPNTKGMPAIWLDVPEQQGKHQRVGTSWTRPVEALAIAQKLQEWMSSEEGKELSFGVISFYKAQADLIKKQLGKIAEDKRLRIGTVDSFQGMEFDVVFLSMVRTLPKNWSPKRDDKEAQARGLFGHLCLYNRLNVSMSRQKKLLVVVGDSCLLQNELAKEFIPGLVDFLELCHQQGEVL